ncbi:MAG: sugar transferase [Ruminococcus sp.]|nr:sugar transferase [Ruminococcus sp.]
MRGDTVYKRIIKRLFDISASAFLFILLLPVMLITALLVRLTSSGPAVFRQERIGRGGKVFTMYKFRTMKNNSEHTGSGVYSGDGDTSVTGVGKVLRATSIDELPQLVNIIKGDMSFLGPRPPLTYHPWTYDRYTKEQLRMFEVRPGISGWAQVNGRRCVEWNERIKMNVWYVDHVSFLLDLKIVFLSVVRVFSNADNKNIGATVTQAPKSPSEL